MKDASNVERKLRKELAVKIADRELQRDSFGFLIS